MLMETYIKDFLSKKDIENLEEKVNIESIFERIKVEINNKDVSSNSILNDLSYRLILLKYLHYLGKYDYVVKEIKTLLNESSKKESLEITDEKSYKINKLLVDSYLKSNNISIIDNDLKEENVLNYKKDEGLDKSYKIEFDSGGNPFNIIDVEYSNKSIISHEIVKENTVSTIYINIKVKANENPYKIVCDKIIIYTTFKTFSFNLKIIQDLAEGIENKKPDKLVLFENFSEFIKIVNNDFKSSYIMFKNEDFLETLKILSLDIQLKNYVDAKKLSYELGERFYDIFLRFNDIYISDKDRERINEIDIIYNDLKEENVLTYKKGEILNKTYKIEFDSNEDHFNIISVGYSNKSIISHEVVKKNTVSTVYIKVEVGENPDEIIYDKIIIDTTFKTFSFNLKIIQQDDSVFLRMVKRIIKIIKNLFYQ